MSNYYEESMPVETDNEDYLKYYLDDTLSLFQQLNTIIKKGEPFQRQALLFKLNIYQSTDLFKSLMEYILNDIETWDKETITLFPKYLYPLFNKPKEILMQSIDNELFNMILKKIIAITSSTDENILREYMEYLEKIILIFNSEKKFPYEIDENIYEDIISLGKVDETKKNQQLSCCLCCTLIRVLKDVKNENVQKLFNRVCYLFSCCEKQIETQLSRELEFLFPIFKQNLLGNSDVLNSINSYLDRDSDFNLQSTTIISMIKNLEFINNNELIEKLVNKLEEIFDDEMNYEKENKNLIFLELIESLEKNYKKIDVNIIRKLFEDNFIAEFIMNNKENNIIIENFDKIYFLYDIMLKELNISNNIEITSEENNKEENIKFNYDELFFGIYNHYLNINYSNNFYTHRKKNYNEAENIQRKILYNNLMKILPILSNFKKNRYLFDKINFLFNNDNILFALNCYAEKFNNEKNNILYNLMYFFLKKNIESQKPNPKPPNLKSISPTKRDNSNPNHESHYVKLFNNVLNNIFHAFNETPNLFDNNIHLLLCDFFQKIIKKIYKYLKPTLRELSNIDELLLGNNTKIKIKTIDKIYEDIYLNYLIKLMNNQQLGNHIRNELVKIFPYLILYGKNRIVYFKYIQENIIESKKYFNRRYSVIYLQKCLEIFSFKMFNKIGLCDFLIQLINDENNAISANIINLIYTFNKKITKNSGIMFKNIIKNLAKINMENKDNKLVHIEDFDIEKNRNITNILSLDLENKENVDKNSNNEYWTNLENKLIRKEKEIFGDDIFYGFHQLKSLVRSQTLNLNSQSLDIKSMNRKSSYINNMINKEVIVIKSKDRINNAKKMLTKDYRYSSSLLINNHNKSSSKTFLPKIKQNRNSCININSISTKIIIRPNIKKINNYNKNKQENQKFHENNSKNNNSMILNEKSSIKTSYDFAKKGKSESKVKIPNSLPSFYPELLNSNNSISLKNENAFIEPNKLRFERKNKDIFLNTIYKSKNNRVHLEYNTKSNKIVKLRKDNLKENSGRYNKIFYKINNGDIDKSNLTNVSLKEKYGQLKRYIK